MSRTTQCLASVLIFCFAFIAESRLVAQSASVASTSITVAQHAGASPALPVFTSRTQLVLVPVMVTGKGGAHVSGLARDVFKVEEGGEAREVTFFEEVKPVAADAKPLPVVKLEGHSNFNFEDAPSGHLTVVVVDLLNTPYLSQGEGKRRLMDYLSKALPRNEATVLFGLGLHGLKQLHPLSADTDALLAWLKRVPGPISGVSNEPAPAGSSDLADAQFQNSFPEMGLRRSGLSAGQGRLRGGSDLQGAKWITLTAMTQIAQAYGTIPGRKTLIWASGGFPFIGGDAPGMSMSTVLGKYEETWRDLIAADIAVYGVDVSGLAGFNGSLVPYGTIAQKQQTLRHFSEDTGGTPCLTTSDLERCIQRVVDDSNSYYLLGYYLPGNDQKPGWRRLKVKVASGGAHVRAREGFYVSGTKVETAEVRQRKLLDALHSPVEFTGVRFNVREILSPGSTADAAGGARHEFAIEVLGKSVMLDAQNENAVDLSVVAVAIGSDNKEHGRIDYRMASKVQPDSLERFRKVGLSTRQALNLAGGKYEIKFAVRDNLNGEIGTVNYPLEVK